VTESIEKRRKAARALLTPIEKARLEKLQAAYETANKLVRRLTIQRLIDKLDDRAEDRLVDREIAAETPRLVITREHSAKPTPPYKRYVSKPFCG
jgi:hypothetical protein